MRFLGPAILMLAPAVLAAPADVVAPATAPADSLAASHGITQHVEAGPVRVDLAIDRQSLNVAQSLVVTLEVTASSSVSVELPTPGDKLGPFSVASIADEPPRAVPGGDAAATRLVRRFTLDPFLPGDYTLPALEVRWKRLATSSPSPDAPADSGVARTSPVTVRVVSLLPEAAQAPTADPAALDPGPIRGRYTPPAPRAWNTLAIGIGAGAAGALLLAWAGRAIYRRRSDSDPIELLISRVESLDPAASDAGRFCDELSRALRLALADRVDPRATSLLADELPARLPVRGLYTEQLAADAGSLLRELDESRYSGVPGAPEELDRRRAQTLSILRALETMPRGSPQEVRA